MADKTRGELRSVGTEEYVDATSATGTVVVAMGAPRFRLWQEFLPALEEVSSAYANEPVSFVTCDIDQNMVIAVLERVTKVPTLIIYHDGRRIGRRVGVMSARRLRVLVSAVCSHGRTDDMGNVVG